MSQSHPRSAESRYYIRHHKREVRFLLELDATPKTWMTLFLWVYKNPQQSAEEPIGYQMVDALH
jgi:hypothetical protein